MTRIGRRLVEDFLVPALDDQRYGDMLKWYDKESGCFLLKWSHKNAAKWSHGDTIVFQDWDKLKGHYHPEITGYYMQAKQRFRAALYKLSSVRKMPCEDKRMKKYQLIGDVKKRKMNYMNKNKSAYPKKVVENRVSVITKHTSLPEKPSTMNYASSPTSSELTSSDKSDSDSDTMEYASCMHDYKIGQKKHNDMHNHFNYMRCSPKKESPLQEVNNAFNRGNRCEQKIPHIPVQSILRSPSYFICCTHSIWPETESMRVTEELKVPLSNPCPLDLCVKSEYEKSLSR